MADNLNIRQPQDPNKINVNQAWEIQYWAQKLGISEERLRSLVAEHGPSVDAIKRALGY